MLKLIWSTTPITTTPPTCPHTFQILINRLCPRAHNAWTPTDNRCTLTVVVRLAIPREAPSSITSSPCWTQTRSHCRPACTFKLPSVTSKTMADHDPTGQLLTTWHDLVILYIDIFVDPWCIFPGEPSDGFLFGQAGIFFCSKSVSGEAGLVKTKRDGTDPKVISHFRGVPMAP